MKRTVLTVLTVASFSFSLLTGCEPELDRNHPLAMTNNAIDDVAYWNTVINTDAHRASIKIMAAIPELVDALPSKVERRKEAEASEKKKLAKSESPVTAEQEARWQQRWAEYDIAFNQLKTTTKPAALAALIASYDKSDSRDVIVQGLIRFGTDRGQAGADVLIKAISDKSEPESAQPAAAAIMEGKLTDQMSKNLVTIIGDASAPTENRYAALRIMAKHPVKEAVAALIKVVKGNPDIQPIALTTLAAEALGKLKAPSAVDALIECLWLNDHLGRNAVKPCRIALNRIGKDASLAKLITTLERKNQVVEKRATEKRYDFGGVIEFKTAEMLGDIPAAAAVEPLIKAFSAWEEMPKAVTGHPTREPHFQKTRVQKVLSLATSLAIIGDERAIEPLLEMAKSKRGVEVMNASIHQLAFLGSPKAIPGMLEILKEKSDINEVATHAFHYQISLAMARILDPSDARSLRAVKAQVKKTTDQLKKWAGELKGVLEKEADPVKRAQMEPNFLHFVGLLKLYAEVQGTIARVEKCKYKPTCWAKELPTRPTADEYRKAYRTVRAVVDTTKACGSKLSCWKEHIPSGGDADSYVKAYKATLAKVNGMERAVPGELKKEYGDKKFISTTAELCKADAKCWKELLPTSATIAGFAQGYETVQKRVDSAAITVSLKRDKYENAELVVSEVERCTSTFEACKTKADACTGEVDACRKEVLACGSVSSCFAKELGAQKNVKPVMDVFSALKIKAEDPAIMSELGRTQKRAKQIIETQNTCKADKACWSGKFGTAAEVEPLLKVYQSAQKKMAERKDKEGKPLKPAKLKKAVERHVKRKHEEGKLIIATGDQCKADVACWQKALGDDKRMQTFRDAYAESKKIAEEKATIAELSKTYRDPKLVAKTGSVCKGDKSPMECWSKKLGSISRANKLMKAYQTATVKTEDRAVIQQLGGDFGNNAFFMVKSGKDCRDKGDCWNNKVAFRNQGWRMLAAYRLGQAKRKSAARDFIVQYLGDGDLIFRNIAMFALRQVADKGDQVAIKGLKAAKKLDEERVKSKKGKYKSSIGAIDLALAQFE